MKKVLYLVCIVLSASVLLPVTGCSGDEEAAGTGEYYTCPMHPTVRSSRPSVCPVCNMTLVKASSVSAGEAANAIRIPWNQQRFANIKTDTVRRGRMNDGLILSGTTSVNENEIRVVSARVRGRIERLAKRNPGEMIRKGDLLYTLYSEELIGAEKEYITALGHREKYPDQAGIVSSLLEAARIRLALMGLGQEQIKELENRRITHSEIPFYSEASGSVLEIAVREGDYVEPGTVLYRLGDLSTLWVTAQLYSNESLSPGTTAIAEIEGRTYTATLELLPPALESNSAINAVKFRIPNSDPGLKPGMMATIQLKGKEKEVLMIPKTALIIGKMPMVWVRTGSELFESRMIKTGMETRKYVEVTEGLTEGELLIISGAYLVNSEFILKKGASAQHQHGH
jgi:membrane fusion protein, copper/silver efflux system